MIHSLPGNNTRPTTERLRQAWLNSLQMKLPDARVLDLFSGSGALGFEALSRGAQFVVFVEENPKAAKIIRENAKTLKLEEQCRVIQKSVEIVANLLSTEPPFDFVFVDPPYEQGHEEKLLKNWPWEEILSEGGKLCIESAYRKDGAFEPGSHLKVTRHERYGDSQLTFYDRVESTRAE